MDVLAQFDVLVPEFQRVLGKTTKADVGTSTPCEGWAVRDLFDHLITGATTFAAIVRGDEPPTIPDTDDDAKLATVGPAIADVDAAFRTPGALERVLNTPFGEMPGEVFGRLLAFDLLMHTWDLSVAIDERVDVPDDVVAEVDGFVRGAISPEMRGPGTFGPELDAAVDASPLERVVAFSGRKR